MKKVLSFVLAAAILFSFTACDAQKETDMVAELGLTAEAKAATEQTVKVNSAFYSVLDFFMLML